MAHDWTKLYKKYKGLRAALLDDESTVVGSGFNAKIAHVEADKNGHKNPLLTRVPNELVPFWN